MDTAGGVNSRAVIKKIANNSFTAVSTVFNQQTKVQPYPSPARDRIFLDGLENKPVKFILYSLEGAKMKECSVSGRNEAIILTGYPAGVYFYVIANMDHKTATQGLLTIQKYQHGRFII